MKPMRNLQKFQTGKRVYNGVSQSPNRGPVSAKGAQGYIKRELNKGKGKKLGHAHAPGQLKKKTSDSVNYIRNNGGKSLNTGVVTPVGSDGKSDSRSAIAAKSLSRLKGFGKK